jgi:glycine cleavage system H protein
MAQVEKFYLPDDLYYETEGHLWVKVEGEMVRIGMDQLGQAAAGTIVHMKIPPVQKLIQKKSNFGFLEAGKFVGPLRMPIDGRIIAINQKVLDHPELVNREPYGEGWMILVRPESLAEDVGGLLHGEETVTRWLEGKVRDYRERGVLPELGT